MKLELILKLNLYTANINDNVLNAIHHQLIAMQHQLNVIQQEQVAMRQQLQQIDSGIIRSSNNSVLTDEHLIIPLRNGNGVLPQDRIPLPQWFPTTKHLLDIASRNNLISLIGFYGLDIQDLPDIPQEPINSKRKRILKRHLGVR